MCGGWNSKLPSAAAIWRQGHLLHFGFEQSPGQMNDVGRAMLENSIHYIAGFTEDRPIGRVISPFSGKTQARAIYLASVIRGDGVESEYVAERFFSGELGERIAAMDDSGAVAWIRARLTYLVPGEGGKLMLAEDLQALDIDVRGARALEQLREALDGERSAFAVSALRRHLPSGPQSGSAQDWAAYVEENEAYLFFSDAAGCAFLLDPLARARSVSTKTLRGPLRSDR